MFEIKEIQVDELCTFVGKTTNTTWLFTIVEVSSRLWPTQVLGRRSYRNTELLLNETVHRGKVVGITLVTSAAMVSSSTKRSCVTCSESSRSTAK
jgi:IS1 family transposase